MDEKIMTIVLENQYGERSPAQLFIRVHQTQGIHTILVSENIRIEKCKYGSFTDCMYSTLMELPKGYKISMIHHIQMEESITEILCIEEIVTLDSNCYILYILKCKYRGTQYVVKGSGDFMDAMDLLAKKLGMNLQSCYFCHFADLMFDGSEELRLGWHCFRNTGIDRTKRWYERMEQFTNAHKFVSAFHWCPSFQRREDY